MSNTVCAIDLGSTTIKIAVGERVVAQENARRSTVHFLGAVEHPTEGMSRGVVTSLDDVVASLTQALEKAERLIGIPIHSVVVGVGCPQVFLQSSKGVVAVSKVDGEIKEEDTNRVIDAAQTVATPPNYEILHVLPRSFSVDAERGIKDPVGMVGTRLEVDAHIVYVPTTIMRNLTKAVYRTGCEIDDVVFSPLATAEIALDHRQRELGVVLLTIGAGTTSFVVFEEGNVLHAGVIPLGGSHVTGDIAIGLRISLESAETIKREYGQAVAQGIAKQEMVPWSEVGEEGDGGFPRKQLAEIIEARMEEIFEYVDRELKTVDRSGQLPSGVVLCGGGSTMEGTVELAKRVFRLPASLARVTQQEEGQFEAFQDLRFVPVMGLVEWSLNAANISSDQGRVGRLTESFVSVGKRLTQWIGRRLRRS